MKRFTTVGIRSLRSLQDHTALSTLLLSTRQFSSSRFTTKDSTKEDISIQPKTQTPQAPGLSKVRSKVPYNKKYDLTQFKQDGPLYASLRIHNRPYLVTVGDNLTLNFRLKDAEVGNILHFTDIASVGSRNYILTGIPAVDTQTVSVKARVIEKTKEPMRFKYITKRRNRKVKRIATKLPHTVLCITEIKLL